MQDKFDIGKIVNTFGIKGEIKVVIYTDNIKQFEKGKIIYVGNEKMKIEKSRYQKGMMIIKLEGIDNMTQAENIRDKVISVERSLEKLPEGTYYIADLINLDVYTDEGKLLGKVKDIYNTGANDIYVINTLENKEILLPAIKQVIKNIDLENKKITVHILKGLI